MAHYAFLDENNVVTEVIVGVDENEIIEGKSPELWYGEFRGQKCVRTSYNKTIRKNFAGIGFTYDEVRDAFVPPKPYSSWVLSEETCCWEAPEPFPKDGKAYKWSEPNLTWEEVVE